MKTWKTLLKKMFIKEMPVDELLINGRRKGENNNPYLSARRSWNDHMSEVIASRQIWQLFGILCLLITLAAVGGTIYIGSQSKFTPYVVAVDQLGQAATVTILQQANAQPIDPRVIHASVASFINDARLVSPDRALQRKAIYRIYSMLSTQDPAANKMNEWLNGTESSDPFSRASSEIVHTEITSVLPQTQDTWQIDWIETTRDRQGILKRPPERMRALVTIYITPATPQTTEEQIRNNPMGIFVKDYSWSRQI